MNDRGSFIAGKDISLDSELVLLGNAVVHAETAMQKMPAVPGILAGRVGEVFVVLIFCKDTVADIFGDFSAILRRRRCLRLRASAHRDQATLGVGCFLG